MLNLYDDGSGLLGPANVKVAGAATGAIHGSLVVDQDNTRITFIQTDLGSADNEGILPSDTYTVTLRSASNGFQDTNGNLLDGTGDGTPGENYVTTFVVNNSANAVVVSLPDFARGPGQDVNVPNTGSGLPLQLLNTAATDVTVTSVTMQLVYNSNLLTVTGAALASGLPDDSSVTVDTTTPGVAFITFTSPGLTLAAGAGQDIISVIASVPSSAGYADKEILDLQDLQINAGSIPAVDDAAVHVVGYLGAVDGSMTYDVDDAKDIAQVAVGLAPGFRQWALADPAIIGNVSGDGQPTVLDALVMARAVVGFPEASIPALPQGVTASITGPDPVMNIGNSCQLSVVSCQSEVVQVPVMLDHSDGLTAVDLAIAYDTSRLVVTAADVQRGSLTAGFDSFVVNVDQAKGIIYISGYRSAGPLPSPLPLSQGEMGNGGGSLAMINFQVKPDAPLVRQSSTCCKTRETPGHHWPVWMRKAMRSCSTWSRSPATLRGIPWMGASPSCLQPSFLDRWP